MKDKIPDKRYLCFEYDDYQAQGGIGDMQCSFDTIEEVLSAYKERRYQNFEVYDRVDGVEIEIQEILKISEK